jgi:hypothetical protein
MNGPQGPVWASARPLGGEAAFAIPPVAPVVADEASAIP